MPKIYFCGSIRGGRQLASTYEKIIRILGQYGQVLTEHLGSDAVLSEKDAAMADREIHDRDLGWVRESDMVIAEVTVPSLGVGYEIGRAIGYRKPVLCLFRSSSGKRLSAMIAGNPDVEVFQYVEPDDLKEKFKEFITPDAVRRTS
jgi:nucleoside 2-deoxyribosyltransferase